MSCPTCGSPAPDRFPDAGRGHVIVCSDAFHERIGPVTAVWGSTPPPVSMRFPRWVPMWAAERIVRVRRWFSA